jgi:hypothetical protein
MATVGRTTYHVDMAVSFEAVGLYASAPTKVGTLIIREGPPGHTEVIFITADGPRQIWVSNLDHPKRLQRAKDWAARRDIDRIYVEGDPDA